MTQATRRRLLAGSLLLALALVVYFGWAPFARLFWPPSGSYVVLSVDGEAHESYVGDYCYGVIVTRCKSLPGIPVGERPIAVQPHGMIDLSFPKASPDDWRATVSRVPAYSNVDRSSGPPYWLRTTAPLAQVASWSSAAGPGQVLPTTAGWYIVGVEADWSGGEATYIFWLDVGAASS